VGVGGKKIQTQKNGIKVEHLKKNSTFANELG
jgi:hypothetical protein